MRNYTRHDMSRTVEYTTWVDMIQRTCNVNNCNYKYYGARGITVCDRWKNSFGNFINDMGIRPSKKYSIERVDNNGNYEPINCRWATKLGQSHNRRTRSDNVSGYPGIWFDRTRGLWQAAIYENLKSVYVGRFNNLNDAIVARDKVSNQHNK